MGVETFGFNNHLHIDIDVYSYLFRDGIFNDYSLENTLSFAKYKVYDKIDLIWAKYSYFNNIRENGYVIVDSSFVKRKVFL